MKILIVQNNMIINPNKVQNPQIFEGKINKCTSKIDWYILNEFLLVLIRINNIIFLKWMNSNKNY